MKRFIVLLAVKQKNSSVATKLHTNLVQQIDKNCRPHWVSGLGVGILVAGNFTARQVWTAATQSLSSAQLETVRDMLVLELGQDNLGWPESRTMAWLNSHRE